MVTLFHAPRECPLMPLLGHEERIHLLPVPATGVFFFNCEGVKYGFFGNLEGNLQVSIQHPYGKH